MGTPKKVSKQPKRVARKAKVKPMKTVFKHFMETAKKELRDKMEKSGKIDYTRIAELTDFMFTMHESIESMKEMTSNKEVK